MMATQTVDHRTLVSSHPPIDGSFGDRTVVLHLVGDPADPDHGPDRWSDSDVGMHQAHDGPTHLVIGRRAPVDALQRAAHRLAIDVKELQRFQAGVIRGDLKKQLERDRLRTALQAPVSRYCVMYLVNGRERQSAWLSESRAKIGLRMMQAKYGERKAIIYVD